MVKEKKLTTDLGKECRSRIWENAGFRLYILRMIEKAIKTKV